MSMDEFTIDPAPSLLAFARRCVVVYREAIKNGEWLPDNDDGESV